VAADLLSRHAWTTRDLAARLRRRGAPPEVADEVVADLTARGYLDDEAFARHWVAARASRGYGPARLRAELRARGVDPALIDAALTGVRDDGELERARTVALRRLQTLQRADRARVAARLRDHLLRRGYPASIVTRVVRECVGLRLEE
jgi:regulatory protein